MHFWIDKRSHCAYTGRHRVPSSLSAGRARGRVCASGVGVVGVAVGRKGIGMTAPVHRVVAVDCPPRRPHRAPRHYTPPPMPSVHMTRRQNDEPTLYVEIPPEPRCPTTTMQQPVQPTTIASLAAARSVTPDTLLRTAALGLHHTPLMSPHLKFRIFLSFALATLFLAGAKYYFDKQIFREGVGASEPRTGIETGVVCAAVVCVCGLGCIVSACGDKRPPVQPPDRVSSTAQRDRPPPPDPVDEMPSTAALPGRDVVNPEAPPPYKIAVLMPARDPSPPPPSYSSLS